MTTYEQIREIRNERLYGEEPPLEFGCEVEMKENWRKKRIFLGKNLFNIGCGVSKIYLEFAYEFGGDEFCSNGHDFSEINKILGKPVSLSDLLRMLPDGFFINNEGVICCYDDEDGEFGLFMGKLDLTKEIKDQEEETLKQLLELIK